MTDNEHVSISFEEVWKSLEEQDKTGVYKRAREMADIAVEQLEYAYNSGYETAKAKYARPKGEWVEKHCNYGVYYRCSNCHKMPPNYECDYKEGAIKTNFCPNCGAEMRKGGAE